MLAQTTPFQPQSFPEETSPVQVFGVWVKDDDILRERETDLRVFKELETILRQKSFHVFAFLHTLKSHQIQGLPLVLVRDFQHMYQQIKEAKTALNRATTDETKLVQLRHYIDSVEQLMALDFTLHLTEAEKRMMVQRSVFSMNPTTYIKCHLNEGPALLKSMSDGLDRQFKKHLNHYVDSLKLEHQTLEQTVHTQGVSRLEQLLKQSQTEKKQLAEHNRVLEKKLKDAEASIKSLTLQVKQMGEQNDLLLGELH